MDVIASTNRFRVIRNLTLDDVLRISASYGARRAGLALFSDTITKGRLFTKWENHTPLCTLVITPKPSPAFTVVDPDAERLFRMLVIKR